MLNEKMRRRIKDFLKTYPYLKEVLEKLKENQIKAGIFAGTFVSLATGSRKSTDVDVLVHDEDIEKLLKLFPEAKVAYEEHKPTFNATGIFALLPTAPEIEFASNLDFQINGHVYPLRLTDLAWKNRVEKKINGTTMVFLNPLDTILQKAILQRGVDQGKRDLEDIENILKNMEIDKDYARERIKETNPDTRLEKLLLRYNLSK